MSIYFRNTPVSAPFMFESLGNHWNQVNIFRPDGYPYYHYLQTEKGTGRIEVRGKFYTLGANEGILIAPGVPHSYHRESTSWTTMFATFTGTLAGSIPSMTDNQEVILIEKEQGASIRKMISSTLRKYHQPTPDMKSLSSDCYNFLMNFTDCAASPKIQDNPLYQRYVIPVIKEIEIKLFIKERRLTIIFPPNIKVYAILLPRFVTIKMDISMIHRVIDIFSDQNG